MKLRELPPDQLIKLGFDGGSGWVYGGLAGDIDWVALNHKTYDDEWDAFIVALKCYQRTPMNKLTRKILMSLIKKADAVQNYIPLADREIKEQFESITEPGVINVLVKGVTSGRIWMLDETPKPVKVEDTNGAFTLVGAIYKDMMSDLESAYYHILADKEKFQKDTAKVTAKHIEHMINENPYGGMDDPSHLVTKTRAKVIREFCYKGGHVVRPIEKVTAMLLKELGEK